MRRIRKGSEPRQLAERRMTPGTRTSWGAPKAETDEWREALHREQLGLCAYCMGRLRLDEARIEHHEPRSSARDRTYDWSNMLGVCQGQLPDGTVFCEAARGDGELHANPTRFPPDVGDLFRYTPAGVMQSANGDAQIEATISRLRLNAEHLKRNRSAVIVRCRERLQQTNGDVARVRREWERPQPDGQLLPYVEVALQYLDKKARARGVSRGPRG